MFEKLSEKLKLSFETLLWIILFLSVLCLGFGYHLNDSTTEWLKNILSPSLKNLGTLLFSVAVFQFLLKAESFIPLIQNAMDIDKRCWEKYTSESIKKVINAIVQVHPFVEVLYHDKKQSSVKLAIEDFKSERQKLLDKKGRGTSLTEAEEHILDKHYATTENRITKTITAQGNEINTFEVDVQFIENGDFVFMVKFWTDYSDIQFKPFQYFLDNKCEKRFSDFSFDATYFNLIKNGKLVQKELYAGISFDSKDDASKKGFICKIIIDDTFSVGDTFTLSFSCTLKGIFTNERIQKILCKQEKKPCTKISTPVGVRKILIQEEIYSYQNKVLRIAPSLFSADKKIDPEKIEQTIFYKKYFWTIYYEENKNKEIIYSVV